MLDKLLCNNTYTKDRALKSVDCERMLPRDGRLTAAGLNSKR